MRRKNFSGGNSDTGRPLEHDEIRGASTDRRKETGMTKSGVCTGQPGRRRQRPVSDVRVEASFENSSGRTGFGPEPDARVTASLSEVTPVTEAGLQPREASRQQPRNRKLITILLSRWKSNRIELESVFPEQHNKTEASSC